MKPFDLERALAGDPVVTRDGRKVLELHLFNKINLTYQLYGFIEIDEESNHITSWNEKGIHCMFANNDLFMAPKKKKLYIGVNKLNPFNNKTIYLTTDACSSLKECEDRCDNPDYEIVEVEIEE